ncbi:MAG: serine/threonine protein kinase [Chloroflexaceae bacterium]|nr:serine/threonine protein kinase [Chloroflexaceae bacterium]
MTQLNLAGTTLGQFTIQREIGRGGMAVVYEAHQATLERTVALKILPPELTRDSHCVLRFHQEARSAARLDHPHIIPIYDIGEMAPPQQTNQIGTDIHYISMKYIQGMTLKDILSQPAQLALPQALHILEQVAQAIDHAHQHGVIHRDLKPSNIMVTPNNWVYLMDFGLAREIHETRGLTRDGTVMGTPDYMSPEQAQG